MPWTYYYLYVILDIFSRYVPGWMIAGRESGDLAEELIATTCAREEIDPDHLTLHSDRGSAMQSKTVAQLLIDLGVAKSHSRPYMASDPPYSESQFRTMKYRPGYPDRFGSLEQGRDWARDFFDWYNHEHHHTGLGLMTSAMVRRDLADAVCAHRQQVLRAAYEAHPERFVRGMPTPPAIPNEVWINKPQVDATGALAVSPPDPTQPGGQAASRVPEGQASEAKRSLDAAEHLATAGKAGKQPCCTESFDTNFQPERSKNA
jgi:putative transposase